jgi:23S rRNA (uracil1939-C5)-methyltransferase
LAETVTIVALGAGGDGVTELPADGRVFVPHTLPGEIVEIKRDGNRGQLLRIVQASRDRVAPPCPHFGVCGGCQAQHLALAAYRAWKRDVVARSLQLHGIEAEVEPIVAVAAESRRRAVFSAIKTQAGIVLGFNQRGSDAIVPISACPVLLPAIVARLPLLRSIAEIAVKPRKRSRIIVVAADNGLDISVTGGGNHDEALLVKLGGLAAHAELARLTVNDTTVFMNRAPEIAAGGAALLPSPGGFVQAVASAEVAMAAAVVDHVASSAPVVDLFAGIGTFSLRLARTAAVTAVEGEAALLAALDAATRRARGLKPIRTSRRDLFVNPLAPNELNAFGAVVFDPPAAGAKRQSEAIALSRVPKVVAVSCNPATLARDARILIDGGYRLTRVLPVDQFLWSAEIEVVACFER